MENNRDWTVPNKLVMDAFIRAYKKANGNVTRAAKACKIKAGRPLVMAWRAKYPWFREAMDNVLDEMIDKSEALVLKKGQTQLLAAQWLLSHHPKGRERGYGKRQEISGPDGGAIPVRESFDVSKLSKTERKVLKDILRRRLAKESNSDG